MNDEIRVLLDKVPGWKNREAAVTPLSGGLTNQNFRVDIDDESFVLRVCSTSTDPLGINRDHEYACSKIAADLGVGAEVIHYSREEGVLVIRFIEGKPVSAEEARQPDKLKRIVESIKRFHDGPEVPGQFCAFETVREYHRLASENGVSFPETLPEVFKLMSRIESALDGVQKSVPCHNDLLAGNFLDDGETMWIIDWEYGGMGDPVFDLGNFAVNQELTNDEIESLIRCYYGDMEAVVFAHLKLMTLASDLREAFWGFLQSGISKLDFDYSSYAIKHLERFFSRASTQEFRSWLTDVAKQ
jgi:thiamine kinase-like enzyme